MPRRPSTRSSLSTAAATAPAEEVPPQTEAAEPTPDDQTDFVQYLEKSLDDAVRNRSTVYVYRTRPKIVKDGSSNIAKYAGRIFSMDMLQTDHGGGRYKLMLDTGIREKNITRYVELPGAAKIYPDHMLVDEQGNPKPVGTAAPQTAGSSDQLVDVLKTVTEALQNNRNSPQKAIEDALAVMRQANLGAVEIIANAAKAANSGEKQSDSAVLQAINNLTATLRERHKDPVSEKVMNAALEKLINPQPVPAAPDMFDQIRKLADLASVDGLGNLRSILGGKKEESFLESIGKELAVGVSEALKATAPSIMQWLRERSYYNYVQHQAATAQTPGQPGAAPPAPAHPSSVAARVPLPQAVPPSPAQPATHPAQPGIPTEEDMFAAMTREVTGLIRRCWDEQHSGDAAAKVIKLAYPVIMPMIRSNFNDLEKVKQMAAQDEFLAPITSDEDFPEWAQDFFEELHQVDGNKTAPPASA